MGLRVRAALVVVLLLATIGVASPAAATGAEWIVGPEIPGPRYGHAAVADPAGRIYLFGGAQSYLGYKRGGDPSADALLLSPTDGWSALPPMAVKRAGLAAALSGERIYVAGGESEDGCQASVEIFDTNSRSWVTGPVPEMSSPRCGHALVAASDGRIYAFGGWNASKARGMDSVEVLDLASGTWSPNWQGATPIAPMPRERWGFAAVAAGGLIYLIGGETSQGYTQEIDVFDPATNAWTTLSKAQELQATRVVPAAAVGADGRIYVIGGYNVDAGGSLSTIEIFDPETGERDVAGPMLAISRAGLAAVLGADGQIYAIGGFNYVDRNATLLASSEVLTTASPVMPPVTAVSLDGPLGGDGWYTGPVQVTLNATGEVDATHYRLDDGDAVEYEAPFWVTGDGEKTLEVWSVGTSGMAETPGVTTIQIDGTPPETSAVVSPAQDEDGIHRVPVVVNFEATDATSGVATTYVRADAEAEPVLIGAGDGLTLADDGLHEIAYWSVDRAGNVEDVRTLAIRIDTTPPVIEPGPPAMLVLQGPDDVAVGQTAALQPVVTDAAGVVLENVALEYEVVPAGCGAVDSTTHIFTAGTIAGICTVTARVASDAAVSGVLTLQLVPGPLARVTLEPAAEVFVGQPVTARGVDTYGNVIAAVVFSSESAALQIDGGTITATAPGDYTIWGTLGTESVAATLTVRRQAVAYQVSAPAAVNAQPFTVMVAVVDGDGEVVEDYSGRLAFVSSDPGASLPAEFAFTPDDAGQATFTVRLATEGEQTLRVSDPSGHLPEASVTVDVRLTPPTTRATRDDGGALDGWFSEAVTIVLSAEAGRAPVAVTYFSINGGAEQQYSGPLTIAEEGSYTLEYWSEDEAGNVEARQQVSFGIDRTAPEIVCAIPDITQWYAENVAVGCSVGDALSGLVLGQPDQLTLVTTVDDGIETANAGTDMHTVCDLASNCAQAGPITGLKIDRRAPTITATLETTDGAPYTPGTWTTQAVTVRFTCADGGAGVDAARLPAPVTLSQAASDQVASGECFDLAGNRASLTVDGINIRAMELAASIALSGDPGNDGWYVGPVTVDIALDGDAVGSEYRVNDGPIMTYAAPFQLTADGTHTVAVRALGPGQATGEWQTRTVRIDATPPTIGATLETADGTPYKEGTWTTQAVTVRFACEDAGSGVDESRLPAPVTHEQPGAGLTASGECLDRAGNRATLTVDNINIRALALVASSELSGEPGHDGWYVGPVTVAIVLDGDAISAQFQVNDGPVSVFAGPFTIDEDGIHEIAYRALGPNQVAGEWQTQTVRIDATSPVIECAVPGPGPHRADVVVPCTASDVESGLRDPADAQFSVSTSVADGTLNTNATTDSRFVCDVAGNCAIAGPFDGFAVDKRSVSSGRQRDAVDRPAPEPPAADPPASDTGRSSGHRTPQSGATGGGSSSVPSPPIQDPGPQPADPDPDMAPPPAPVIDERLLPAAPQEGCRFFAETGHNLCFGFRDFWERFGGLERYGYPLTEEFVEDGLTVQYFERARFEWHPGVWPERYDVLLGRLGAEVRADWADLFAEPESVPPASECRVFVETGRSVCGAFRAYWEQFGGLATFGLPLTGELLEGGRVVQYFERARFELHPGAWPERYDVLLGRLGAEVLTRAYGLAW